MRTQEETMTEETVVPTEDGGDDGKNVYDYAELRFVDNAPGRTAKQTADDLNAANKDPKVGRADGKRGPRYGLL
jgi:hypothetical protein